MTDRVVADLLGITASFARRGWFPGTSGNLSARVSAPGEPLLMAVSASGRDKEAMTAADFLLVDGACRSLDTTAPPPSAETVIHACLYEATGCGSVLHVHTVFNNLVSELCFPQGEAVLRDMELIKGLNIWEEGAEVRVPIVENLFSLPALATAVGERLADPRVPGVLIRRHGLYAWGAGPFEAKRHLEAFEFMFEYLCRLWTLREGRGLARAHSAS